MVEVKDVFSYYWQPKTDAQRAALESEVDFLLFGGAAGSLKSETLLVNAIKYRDNRHSSSVIFRRTFPELEQLIRRSRDLYTPLGALYNEQKKTWRFPSGSSMRFAFCERDEDINRQYGAEYSFIGWDESTHFGEYPIRFMFSRLRSKDVFMQEHLRQHLATNPGNQGHLWHKAIFLGPTCTHCKIVPLSRLPGRVYRDSVWPSDGRRIGKTTAFIPGRLTDHNLLGADYKKQLEGLPANLAKALKDGCWDVYEGQFFDCWDESKMVKTRQWMYEQVKFWYPHIIGMDYGFNISTACAYLIARGPATPEFPRGRVFVVDEFSAKHMLASDFACSVQERWHVGDRKIIANYLSPDAWNKRGDGHTLADQMTEATSINFEKASNDRIGGAMLLYSLLDSGEMVIGEDCLKLRMAIPTRIHNPMRPDDILKVTGDELDDCYDSWRYAAYSYLAKAEKPNEILLQEAAYSMDPTCAMIQWRMAQARHNKADDPIAYNEMGDRRGYKQ